MTSQLNLTHEERLRDLSDQKAMTLLPAILFVGILMVMGLLGNGLVCFIFARRLKAGTQNIMILCLAASDLLICSIGMPTEIADMRFHYTFESEFACKLFRFVNSLCSLWSILTLVAIAVDRYIKVCRPFGRQMTIREAKTTVLISLTIAILVSWPTIFIYGTRSADTKILGLFGKDCSTSDAMKGTSYPLIFNSILFVGFVSFTIVFIVLYAKIYRKVKRQKEIMDKARTTVAFTVKFSTLETVGTSATSTQSDKPNEISPTTSMQTDDPWIKPSASSGNSGEVNRDSVENRADHRNSVISDDEPTDTTLMEMDSHGTADLRKSISSVRPKTNDLRGADRGAKGKLGEENRTTVIVFLVTIVFVLSYLPYLAMTFSSIFNKGFDHHLRGSSLAAYNLFLRSYFVNSAVNPIIYGFLNPQFSRAVAAMFKSPTCCRPSRIYDCS
ncbi:5-hydroxytryptamine receptor [Patella vulgata]|uniref:5-hydroxytryptamine receptor n=1 Tax=Patella vulgata TaxID=6465 RepID=UPI00217F4798|nr:5-hydroxytryptamine receptor [Patella vulgata]